MSNFEPLMRRAITIAEQSLESSDVPVGALVLNPAGEIVGEGMNLRERDNDPTAHAEIVAMRAAALKGNSWRLDGHTLVVTLEPCAMCAGAISQARIKTLVFGAWDAKAGAVGSVWEIPRDPRSIYQVEVFAGILADECGELLRGFFKGKR